MSVHTPKQGGNDADWAREAPPRMGRYMYYSVPPMYGSTGVLHKAFDRSTRRDVIIKTLAPQYARIPVFQQMLCREGLLAGQLRHPNVVRIHDLDITSGESPLLVMDYVKGGNLHEEANEVYAPDQEYEASDFYVRRLSHMLRAVVQACKGVAHAHANGVIHRDVTPSNIMTSRPAQIIDWGSAMTLKEAAQGTNGQTIGTTSPYRCSEQAYGRAQDERTDVAGLGAVLYKVCTGSPPYTAKMEMENCMLAAHGQFPPVRELNARIPRRIAAVCEQAMACDPNKRFQSVMEFRTALLSVLKAKPPVRGRRVHYAR